MSYKLFRDDLRTVQMVFPDRQENEFVVVRSYEAFVDTISTLGLPTFICFDNDLEEDEAGQVAPDGYAAAKWLVYESGLDLTELDFQVHSANPVAKTHIEGLLRNYIRHLRKNNE